MQYTTMATNVSIGFSQLSSKITASRKANMGPHRLAKRAKFFADICGLSGGILARYSLGGSLLSSALTAADTIIFCTFSTVIPSVRSSTELAGTRAASICLCNERRDSLAGDEYLLFEEDFVFSTPMHTGAADSHCT